MLQIFSALEQFLILPLLPFTFRGIYDFSITNCTIIFFLLLFLFFILYFLFKNTKDSTFDYIPDDIQILFEVIYSLILSLVLSNIKNDRSAYFFPLVFVLFTFVLAINTIGLIPYSFTLTSQIVVTLFLSVFIFIGINIIAYKIHNIKIFSLFLPAGTDLALALLLVPIEAISYIFKPISLSIRLFANMMAGHTLLKVIAGFAFTLIGSTGAVYFFHLLPLIVLIPLFGLELAVAFIQSYVFTILICIYLNDSMNLH